MPNFDLFNFSFPCFIAGTLVLTNKGYKNIEDIKEGDMVLTHTNTYQKVVKPMINKANSIYRLKTMCSEDLLVTEEHPFYVRKKKRINTRIKGKAVNYREFSNPQWVKIKDLSKDYYVGIAINQESKLPNWNGVEVNSTWVKYGNKKLLNTIKKYFNNNDFWWIVGRYMGDGWVKNIIDHKGTDIYDLYICCAKDELHEITDVLDNLNLINNDFKYKYYEDRTVYKIRISNVEFAKFLQQFGKGAKNKKLNNTIIDLPKNLLKSFLDGYISADGYFTKNIYKCSSISNKLIYGIGQCVAKVHNAPFSIYKTIRSKTCVIEGRIVNQNDVYDIAWKIEKKKQDKAFYEDGYIWCPINGLEKEQYNGLVYNMEVENDNSYTANNIIVHNCTDISVAGKQKGMKDKKGNMTRSGLYTYGINIIQAKKPKYIMIENVKNLISKKFINDFYSITNEINNIGYNCYYPKNDKDKPICLNAKNYGVPQNRERIYVICIRKDTDDCKFQFPDGFDNGIRLKDLLEEQVDEKYYISEDKTRKLLTELKAKNIGINPCLTSDRVVKSQNGRRFKENDEPAFTINTQDKNGVLINQGKVQFKDDDISSCINSNYYKGLDNHAARTGILETGVYNQKDGFKQKDIGCTLDASYYKGLGNNQNRNAILELSILKPIRTKSGEIKEQRKNMTSLEPRTDEISNTLTTVQKDNLLIEPNNIDVVGKLEMKGQDNIRSVYNPKGISPALTTMEGEHREPKILESNNLKFVGGIGEKDWAGDGKQNSRNYPQGNRVYDSKNIAVSQTAQGGGIGSYTGLYKINNNCRIRKLTPLECWRLMSFDDEDFYKVKNMGISDTQLYKMAGNSIVVKVLEYIFKNLFDI
ncbi:DNA (cytosine-5-)-methyltransferase [Clostridium sp. MT-14]|uniref:DNA (cytosine-5-)-methyltransferase n=1 Tax=Clostridium sp. MT-14 TaxID=3348360 RepID=UPI0035F37C4F